VEFAYFLNTLGTETTLVEMMDRIVPVEDHDISSALSRSFKKQGIHLKVGTKVDDVKVGKNSVKLKLSKGDKTEEIEVESVLLSIGVEANMDGLLGPRVKPELNRGYLVVDDTYQSTVKGIYG